MYTFSNQTVNRLEPRVSKRYSAFIECCHTLLLYSLWFGPFFLPAFLGKDFLCSLGDLALTMKPMLAFSSNPQTSPTSTGITSKCCRTWCPLFISYFSFLEKVIMKLTVWTRLVSNSQKSACLGLEVLGLKMYATKYGLTAPPHTAPRSI